MELGSINSLRVTGFDVPVVDLDLSAWMQFVEPITRKTERAIVSLMIGRADFCGKLNCSWNLAPLYSYIALETAVGFAGRSLADFV